MIMLKGLDIDDEITNHARDKTILSFHFNPALKKGIPILYLRI